MGSSSFATKHLLTEQSFNGKPQATALTKAQTPAACR